MTTTLSPTPTRETIAPEVDLLAPHEADEPWGGPGRARLFRPHDRRPVVLLNDPSWRRWLVWDEELEAIAAQACRDAGLEADAATVVILSEPEATSRKTFGSYRMPLARAKAAGPWRQYHFEQLATHVIGRRIDTEAPLP